MKFYYDFHIHSALSPCADDDMTPSNIVNMAMIKELDIIAIADHNSIYNIPAALKTGEETGVIVVPGMEMETREEVHILCLFHSYSDIQAFYEEFSSYLNGLKNRKDIFGSQYIFDEYDNIVGEEERMLSGATTISLKNAVKLVEKYNGIAIPAHIDKPSYSIISNLFGIPEELGITAVEIKNKEKIMELKKEHPIINSMNFIHNSDAHNLGLISEKENCIELSELSIEELIKQLKNKN